MNPISKALDEVRQSIPPEILQYAFITIDKHSRFSSRRVPVSLDSVIKDKVISDRVLPDCNIGGGVHVNINLSGLPSIAMEQGYRSFQIPHSLTQGRNIISCRTIGTTAYMTSHHPQLHASGLESSMRGLLDTAQGGSMGEYSTSNVHVVGENTILVEDDISHYMSDLQLYCILSYDEDMSTLPPRAFREFSKLVILAVKAYIYNTTRIKLGQGMIQGGMELGVFKEEIDSYADANELYQENLRTRWSRVAILSDKVAKKKHIRLATPLR